jgi:hypothetical protein
MADAVFSLLTAILSFTAVVFLVDQYVYKPRPYKLVWAIGLFVYGVAGLAQFGGTLTHHWTPLEYRVWYLTGAILAAPYLGMGTLYLLAPRKWANIAMIVVGTFTAYAIVRTLTAPLAPQVPAGLHAAWIIPGHETVTQWLATAGDDAIVSGAHPLMPGDITFVIAFLNSLGALALVGGAAWSAWRFIRTRQNPTRLVSMVLLVIGGLAPTLAGSLNKAGISGAFFTLTFVGALFLLAGYLVSIEIFTVFRVPFTDRVLLDRQPALALATGGAAGPLASGTPQSKAQEAPKSAASGGKAVRRTGIPIKTPPLR